MYVSFILFTDLSRDSRTLDSVMCCKVSIQGGKRPVWKGVLRTKIRIWT